MDDKFNYDDVCYFQNLQRFIPSEEQKAARRNYLALLMLFGLIQLMGDTPERANIFGLEIGANHMDAFLSVIIIVFLYLLFLYRSILYENFTKYISTKLDYEHYFHELNKLDFTRKLQRIHRGLQPEDALVIQCNKKYSILQYKNIFPHPEWEDAIDGYDKNENTYTYVHTSLDWEEFEKRKPNLQPSHTYNFMAFRFPIIVGYALIIWFLLHKLVIHFY